MKSLHVIMKWLVSDCDEVLPTEVRRVLGPQASTLVETVLVGFAIFFTAAVARLNLILPPQ
jgi:hypothetical protein